MNIFNIFSNKGEYIEGATLQQIAIHTYRNWDKVLSILVQVAKDNHCLICGVLSLNYQSKASLGNHLRFTHKERTQEYVRDNLMVLTLDELQDLMNQ